MTIPRKVILVAALACLWSTAHAKAPPKVRARALFIEANQLFDRGMLQDALTLYRQARDLYPSFKIDLNIGGTLDALGRRTEAAIYFERFLLNASKAPKGVAREAKRRLKALRRKLGWIKITCMVEGAVIMLDGRSVGRTPRDLPLYVTPGRHRISLERAGYLPKVKMITMAAGKRKALDFLLDPVGQPGVSAGAAAPLAAPAVQKRRRTKNILALSALGLGVALTAGAAALYGVGLSKGNDAYESYLTAGTLAEADSTYEDVQSAKTLVIVGHALLGAAVAAYGFSFYSFVTRPCTAESSGDERPAVSVAPTSGGAYLSVGGRF